MPVDIFGRTTSTKREEDSGHVIFRGINMTQANDTFLRRDGENTAENDINLNLHKLINVANPTNDKDAANKEYVDSNIGENTGLNKVSKTGDTMTGDLLFTYNPENDNIILGCVSLPRGKRFNIAMGNRRNRIEFQNASISRNQSPLTLKTTHGFLIDVNGENVCHFGDPSLTMYKNIEMNSKKILYLTEPTYPHEAVSKNYVDRRFVDMAILSYEGHIPSLERADSKTGFVVSSSSHTDSFAEGWLAFAAEKRGEWATSECEDAWLQVYCPTPVKIWKIRLTDRRLPGKLNENITSWKLSAGDSSDELVDIYTTETKLGYHMQEFSITTLRAYSVYRLTVLSAESERSIGLSYFQIYAKGYYALQ